MRFVIAGASGLIGGALSARLRREGHDVVRLVRTPTREADEAFWNPAALTIDATALTGADVVVNLSGANVAAGRWTNTRRREIEQSRLDATRTLVSALRGAAERPRVLINASAIGLYGDCGDSVVTEDHAPGNGFLAHVCQAWEAEAVAAERAGVRTCRMRFGVVLSPHGGALAKLLPIFRAGLGGRVGSGDQWMSWISLDDVCSALIRAAIDPAMAGTFNVVAPEPVTNRAFTRELAHALRRPALLPVPAFVLRAVFGQMADETLLASARVVPQRLAEAGFAFQHRTLAEALADLLPAKRLGAAAKL